MRPACARADIPGLTHSPFEMPKLQKPPKTYQEFMRRFPKVGKAWELTGEAGREGPLDVKCARLVKLALSIGTMREGAVHAAVRKALAVGVTRAEIDQVITLAAGSIGFPATVAVYSWIEELVVDKARRR